MTANIQLTAYSREETGTPSSKKIRRQAQIPAIIYSKDKKILLSVDEKEFNREYFKGDVKARKMDVTIGKDKYTVMPYIIDIHPVKDTPNHIDFMEVKKGEKIKVSVKVACKNKSLSPGIKRGGFLNTVLRRINIICNSDEIPESIEIDMTGMLVGGSVKVKDLKIPNGATVTDAGDLVVVVILGRGGKKDDEETEGEGEEGATTEEEAKK